MKCERCKKRKAKLERDMVFKKLNLCLGCYQETENQCVLCEEIIDIEKERYWVAVDTCYEAPEEDCLVHEKCIKEGIKKLKKK